jgi:hypothetical protein
VTRMSMIAHRFTVGLMAVTVLVATSDGFAQSYAGLYHWALEHSLHGWKAESFPLMVDLFILVGELGMFALALEGHKLTRKALSWADLAVPAGIAAGGWIVSLVFNVGAVRAQLWDQLTAAVPPVASMLGLLVLLRTLHRLVTRAVVAANGWSEVLVPALTVAPVPGDDDPDPVYLQGARVFADDVTRGHVPGIRAIKQQLKVGQPKAREVRAYLQSLAVQ